MDGSKNGVTYEKGVVKGEMHTAEEAVALEFHGFAFWLDLKLVRS